MFQDPYRRKNFLQNEAISEIVFSMWYGHHGDSGVIFSDRFNRPYLPVVTVALVLTAVCFSLSAKDMGSDSMSR